MLLCRMMAQGANEATISAFTTGTAVLALLHWLSDTRCLLLLAHCRRWDLASAAVCMRV